MNNQTLLRSFEAHINRSLEELLATDPANSSYLTQLNGAVIAVKSLAPEFSLQIQIHEAEVILNIVEQDITPQLVISGTALNLSKLLISPVENAAALRNSGIEVSGDAGLLLDLSQLSSKIEVDWEQLLSEKIGETPAVVLSRVFRTSTREGKKVAEGLSKKTKDHLYQSRILPTKEEAEEVRKTLRELNYRLDRIEAANKKRDRSEAS